MIRVLLEKVQNAIKQGTFPVQKVRDLSKKVTVSSPGGWRELAQ